MLLRSLRSRSWRCSLCWSCCFRESPSKGLHFGDRSRTMCWGGLACGLLARWGSSVATRPRLYPHTLVWRADWRWRPCRGVRWERSSLDWCACVCALSRPPNRWTLALSSPTISLLFCGRLLCFDACVVEGHLDPYLSSIFSPTSEAMPCIDLASAWDHDSFEAGPGLADKLRLLVVIEYRNFELVVVG